MSTTGQRSRRSLGAVAAAAVMVVAGVSACADPLFNVVITNRGLFPVFQTSVTDYVNRCDPDEPTAVTVTAPRGAVVSVAGRPGRRGTFTEHLDQRPNERFGIVVTLDGTTTVHRVRCLPEGFPEWQVHGSGQPAQSEFYVTTLISGFGPTNRPVIFDAHGVPMWWSEPAFSFLTTPLRNGNLASLPITGGMIERRLDGSTARVLDTEGAPSDFHDVLLLENGHYVLVTADYRTCDLTAWGREPAECLFHEVQELTPEGEVVWRWRPEDDIPITETPPRWRNEFDPVKNSVDPWHWNSIEWVGDGYIVSLRHQDAIYKIDYATRDIAWKLGGTRTAKSLRVIGDPYFDLGSSISGQHDARLLPDGTISLFDNRTNSTNGQQPRSVRYRIDEAGRTATLVQSVSDPILAASPCCGSTRVLPGGNHVVGWGGGPWFTENEPDGDQVFRIGIAGMIYRVVPLAPGEMSRDALRAGMDAQYDGAALSAVGQSGPQLPQRDPASAGDPRTRLGADP